MIFEFQSKFINQWADSLQASMKAATDFADQTGSAMDSARTRQLNGLRDYMMVGTQQAGQTWDAYCGMMFKHTARDRPVALVTGGTGGIGTEICRALAEAGNRVVATHIPAEQELAETWRAQLRKEGLDVRTIACDVTDFDNCAAMSKEVAGKWGAVEVLVNCAGITRDNALRKMDEAHWHAVLDTNLDSVFNVTKNFIDGMVERGYGRVINISSVNGQKGQFGQTNYSAAKAGMIGFTKSLARELADHGVTVNTVSPGYVATDMVMAVPEEIRQAIVSKIPVGRLGEPKEVAQAVAFLASKDNGYITGTDIAVNGGLLMS